MTQIFHTSVTYLSSTLILLAGIFMLVIRLPEKEEWRYLRNTRICIVLSYTLLALAGIASVLYEMGHGPIADRRGITLSVAFFQAVLFTFTAIVYIRPRYLTAGNIRLHVGVLLPFSLLAAVSGCLPFQETALKISWAAYILLMGWCTWLFNREYRKGLRQLETHTEKGFGLRLHWIKSIFYGALCIGILALACSICNPGILCYDLFTVIHTVFYLYVIDRLNHCLRHESYIIGLVAADETVPSSLKAVKVYKEKVQKDEEKAAKLDKNIQDWLDEERYLVPNTSIDGIANALQATHDELNEWCTEHYGMLFRTWRMQLRIEKAQQLLMEHPDMKITRLQEMTGFSDKSHFFKQFKQITGMTTSEFKKNIAKAPAAPVPSAETEEEENV